MTFSKTLACTLLAFSFGAPLIPAAHAEDAIVKKDEMKKGGMMKKDGMMKHEKMKKDSMTKGDAMQKETGDQ